MARTKKTKDGKALLYPRDPTLDPQLVWRGKDEQDRSALAVPIVPLYVQETIQPKALIEDLRSQADHVAADEDEEESAPAEPVFERGEPGFRQQAPEPPARARSGTDARPRGRRRRARRPRARVRRIRRSPGRSAGRRWRARSAW